MLACLDESRITESLLNQDFAPSCHKLGALSVETESLCSTALFARFKLIIQQKQARLL